MTLTPVQLGAISVGIASLYPFPVEVQAVGSVGFTDDPTVIQAESTLLGTAATFDLTRKELARLRSLGTSNGVAEKELEQAISDAQTAEAAYKAARDAVRALGQTDAEIDRMVRTGKIETPQTGYRAVKWVVANVAEGDSVRLRAGEPVAVSVPALSGQKFQGIVSEVYSTIDPATHRLTLRAQVPDPENMLRPGMLADVTIKVGQAELSIGIPEAGIVREGDGTMTAWVTRDRRHFEQRVVTTGLRKAGRVQVAEGLRTGEQVVTNGAIYLDNMLNATPGD